MHVLVTGGAGYIGSHLCKALAKEGYIPVTYDSFVTGNRSAVRWGPLVEADILDTPKLLATLKLFKPVAVFHLASYSNARESILEPELYYQNNVRGTDSLLEALEAHPVPYLIFSSSASVYGGSLEDSLAEHLPLNPQDPYARTKLLAEKNIGSFCEKRGIHYAILRYFNVAGADLDGEIGESHSPETHLIPVLIQTLQGLRDFSLFKSDHNTSDGTAKRDFVHVVDIAKGHIDALNWLKKTNKNITINLGSGKGFTILEIIQKLQERSGKLIPVQKKDSGNLKEPSCLIANTQLAEELIAWKPTHSEIDLILETALRWHL